MPVGRAEVSPGQGSSCVADQQIDHDHEPDAATESSQQLNDGARIGDADYWLNNDISGQDRGASYERLWPDPTCVFEITLSQNPPSQGLQSIAGEIRDRNRWL